MNDKGLKRTDMAAAKRIFTSVQVLRGLAALAIVLFHISEMLLRYTNGKGLFCLLAPLWKVGASGVDLFFIISGFVMVESTHRLAGKPGAPGKFFLRRLIRIIPLYWVYSLLMLLFVVLPFTLRSEIFSAGYTFNSLFLIPDRNPTSGLPLPLLPQGWTLWYEMYFYLLFTLLLFFDRRVLFPFLAAFFSLSTAAGLLVGSKGPIIEVLTSPLLLEFLMGCFLARLAAGLSFSGKTGLFIVIAGCVLLAGTAFLDTPEKYRVVAWGVPSFLIVSGCVFREIAGKRSYPSMLERIGDASYSIYLSHIFILLGIGTLLKRNLLPPGGVNDLVAAVSVLLCIAWGIVSLRTIESRTLMYLRSLLPTNK